MKRLQPNAAVRAHWKRINSQHLEHPLKDDVAEDAQNQFNQELKHGQRG